MHGVTPSEAAEGKTVLHMFTKLDFELNVSGGTDIPFVLRRDDDFNVLGICEDSPITDTLCCESVWNDFYEKGVYDVLKDNGLTDSKIIALYENGAENVRCTIGVCTAKNAVKSIPNGKIDVTKVSDGTWACFEVHGADEQTTNDLYRRILEPWMQSSGFKRDAYLPDMEIFPEKAEGENYDWEIRIPVKINK